MRFGRRLRPSPALVVASLALLVSLAGTSIAAVDQLVPRGSVGTPQLKNNAVTSKKVRNGSLLRADFKAGQVPAGPPGVKGDRGDKGDAGPLVEFLPTGSTLRGGWGAEESTGVAGGFLQAPITFAFPLQNNPTVAFAPSPNCPGTSTSPQANAGYLCVWPLGSSPTGSYALADGSSNGNRRYGVMVYRVLPSNSGGNFYGTYAVTAG